VSATPKPGRPEVGPNINVRLPQDLLEWVDDRAEAENQTRAEVIRDVLNTARGLIDWTERTQERWRQEDEQRARAALTVSPTLRRGYWHSGRVPKGIDPREWLERVLTIWRDRYANAEGTHVPYTAQYARGVAMHRLGYDSKTPGGRDLDNDERREVREQIDEILEEVRKEASNG
jgi:Arc/MetJ-type ribon-helix-helix transcriptional regulator